MSKPIEVHAPANFTTLVLNEVEGTCHVFLVDPRVAFHLLMHHQGQNSFLKYKLLVVSPLQIGFKNPSILLSLLTQLQNFFQL